MSFRNLIQRFLLPTGKHNWQQLMVGDEEFRRRFYHLWKCYPPRIGIAVSGGVDSMALAWLTKSLAEAENMKVHAFIVDHGARPESAEEAQKVAEIMAGYSFQPHVLQLSWGPEGLPTGGFETAARTARYQALAQACVENEVRHVLLGHHSDDLAETVMMRMICSSRAEGLRGMKHISRMPETWGIYGADEIEIGRPFLSVSKTRLKCTCKVEGVRWFEDPTNNDPSYTRRNAIRKLLSTIPPRLPKALQKPALVEMAHRVAAQDAAVTRKAREVLALDCEVNVNQSTGTLQMMLPPTYTGLGLGLGPNDPAGARIMLRVLTVIAERVTPLRKIKRKSMINVLANIYERSPREPIHFTAAGLSWTRGANKLIWSLRRVPHTHRARAEATVEFDTEPPNQWSEWKLWDGRWWIRVQSLRKEIRKVVVRPLAPEDMKQLRGRVEQIGMPWIMEELANMGPKARFTVPVIAIEERSPDDWEVIDDWLLIGLPSFGVDLMNRNGPYVSDGRLVRWKISFRKPM